MKRKASAPMTARAPNAAPIPIPAFAPVLSAEAVLTACVGEDPAVVEVGPPVLPVIVLCAMEVVLAPELVSDLDLDEVVEVRDVGEVVEVDAILWPYRLIVEFVTLK